MANTPCTVAGPGVTCAVDITVSPLNTTRLTFLTAVVMASLYSTDVRKDAARYFEADLAQAHTVDNSLLRDHEHAWRARASRGLIAVTGDLTLARAINASLFVLNVRMNTFGCICVARFLLQPVLCLLQADVANSCFYSFSAKSALQYRISRPRAFTLLCVGTRTRSIVLPTTHTRLPA